MTKEDFVDWKTNPVTKAFFSAIRENIEGLRDELVPAALNGETELAAAKAGAILALNDVLEYRVEDEESHGN